MMKMMMMMMIKMMTVYLKTRKPREQRTVAVMEVRMTG